MSDPRLIAAFDLLFTTARLQGLAWTIIDFLCVFFVLRIVDQIRLRFRKRRARGRWILASLSLLGLPAIARVENRKGFFEIEAVCVTLQFVALLLCTFDIPCFLELLDRLEKLRSDGDSSPEQVAQTRN
ncbi:MAG: hypothetical protein D6679_06210 [Candidatus Hydrogenedentota bacterium]|nr:MAG: hypothetical protein D6679_06210 [Candidatus Hydrogenedentota bacterium]